jgi:hypothetical protein
MAAAVASLPVHDVVTTVEEPEAVSSSEQLPALPSTNGVSVLKQGWLHKLSYRCSDCACFRARVHL